MHLDLTERELTRLGQRIEDDFEGAKQDHRRRMDRFRGYYQKWRNRVDPPRAGEEDKSNFSMPLMQWHVFGRWAQEMRALFGEDAEIIAKPTGPSDQKTVHKVGRYMSWRAFQAMRLHTPFTVFIFRKLVFGRSHAYRPWERKRYLTPEGKKIHYNGPGFFPMWPDDLVVPAEDADSIQDFSFVIRKFRVTPQQLLDGEREKYPRYFGIEKNFESIVKRAMDQPEREPDGDEIKEEKDEAEGVTFNGSMQTRGSILCLEWYGKWRMPKNRRDAREDSIKGRNLDESELVVRYLPDLNQVVGVHDLVELYPHMVNRRPFAECSLVKDGSYWCAGFGELLESIEDEATANHRLFTDAGQFSVGPLVIYKPGAGFNPKTFRYDPFTAIPSEDPGAARVITLATDLSYSIAKAQAIEAIGEKVSNVSDLSLGRGIDRPNAPKTATGQVALIEQGNIRVEFDTDTLREDLSVILSDFWALDREFAPKSLFFRVTEEDAKGLFETSRGGAQMTDQERQGNYDFTIKFATSTWSREAEKQKVLARYQLDLGNPLIVQNPRALWMITNQAHKALGDDNFADIVPAPPDLDQPKDPKVEWTLMLQGEEAPVNPMDNDDLHLVDHYRRIEEAKQDRPEDRDQGAENLLVGHIIAHEQQKRAKMMMQALTQRLVQSIQGNTQAGGAGLTMGAGMPMPLQELQAALGNLTGQDPAGGAPAGGAPPGQTQ